MLVIRLKYKHNHQIAKDNKTQMILNVEIDKMTLVKECFVNINNNSLSLVVVFFFVFFLRV